MKDVSVINLNNSSYNFKGCSKLFCSKFELNFETFRFLSLETINISENNIKSIDKGSFSFSNLKYLNLKYLNKFALIQFDFNPIIDFSNNLIDLLTNSTRNDFLIMFLQMNQEHLLIVNNKTTINSNETLLSLTSNLINNYNLKQCKIKSNLFTKSIWPIADKLVYCILPFLLITLFNILIIVSIYQCICGIFALVHVVFLFFNQKSSIALKITARYISICITHAGIL